MSLGRHREEWERLAETDAMWAVLTAPDRKGGRWNPREFFATGEAEVEHVLATAAGLGRPARRERALDFGCGVGRLTRALGQRFGHALGLDVSKGMVERARALNADVPTCEFRVNDALALAGVGDDEIDLVYSSIVLQHLQSAEQIAHYVEEFVRVTRPDGIAIFGIPSRIPFPWSLQPRRRAYALLRALGVSEGWMLRRTPLTPMRMTALHEGAVRELLARAGATVLHTERIDEGPVRALRYYVSPNGEPGRHRS
jgi:SAM-dependent methyltransferase